MTVDTRIKSRIRSLKKNGEAAFRRRIFQLSFMARAVVCAFESGASSNDLIRALAWRYRQGPWWTVTRKERLKAQVEFTKLVKEIREALDKEDPS